jgi:hypothetical protein
MIVKMTKNSSFLSFKILISKSSNAENLANLKSLKILKILKPLKKDKSKPIKANIKGIRTSKSINIMGVNAYLTLPIGREKCLFSLITYNLSMYSIKNSVTFIVVIKAKILL